VPEAPIGDQPLLNQTNSVNPIFENTLNLWNWPWDTTTESADGDKPTGMPADFYKSFQQVVEAAGFGFEQHQVTTEDGYILTVFRIKNADVQAGVKQPVVFMQHGLVSLADTWIYNTPDVAPAFTLARAGYDIWLGNNRGNVYSRTHTSLVADKDSEYFNYSFDKLGKYDLPAQIDMVKAQTGVDKVTYMGHSQGTSQMFYALSTFPNEISSRVNLFVACAPVTRMKNADSSLQHISGELGFIESSMDTMSIYKMFDTKEVNGYNSISDSVVGKLFKSMSSVISNAVRSKNPVYDNQERLKAGSCRFPNEASTKEFYHYGQLITSGNF